MLKGSGVKKIVKKDNGELTYGQDGAENDITLDSLIWILDGASQGHPQPERVWHQDQQAGLH